MASERPAPTATDYVVTALSPVLVMLMVGSLVFFLVEVLYEGQYTGRLLYTLFFFVAGAVLVARIAIETDAGRAALYGLLLGGVTYVALLAYVEYPRGSRAGSFGWLINLGLLALIGFSAHQLTWDCTHIDEKRKGAGRGLLSAVGLDPDAADRPDPTGNTPQAGAGRPQPAEGRPRAGAGRPQPGEGGKAVGKGSRKIASSLWDWIGRYRKYRQERRQAPHTPGVWVIYFGLAALPLFALGQSLIPADDAARRRATFLHMVVYLASALGLLVTTSLLGLRRYLRQRKADIPLALSGGWLLLGGTLIVGFLTLGAFLPRPHAEVPWFGISRASTSEREASRYAVLRDAVGPGDSTGSGDVTGSVSGKGSGDGTGSGPGKEVGSGKGSGVSGKGSGVSGKGSGDGTGSGPGKGGGPEGDRGGGRAGEGERSGSGSGPGEAATARGPEGFERSVELSQFGGLAAAVTERIAEVLRWVVFAVVAGLVVGAVALTILRGLAPFTNWAWRLLEALRGWWANLWGRAGRERDPGEQAVPPGPTRPPPFAAFSNPFADGTARRRSPAELVAYTFRALDSWAWDRESGREPNQTPLELVARLAERFPDLSGVLAEFARVYARVTYSADPPPPDSLTVLEETWEGLVHAAAVRA